MAYKPRYTKEEIDELVNWFHSHKVEQTVDLGNGVSTTHVDDTVKPMLHIAEKHYNNPTFSGQIHMLFLIREQLIAQNKVLD